MAKKGDDSNNKRVAWFADDDPLKALTTGEARYWMLLVGANRYQASLPNLKFAARDCQELEKALRAAAYQFPNKIVLSHHDDSDDGSFPDLRSVCTSLKQIRTEAKEQDTVLVYFSGHGTIDSVSGDLFLCLADTDTDNLQDTGWALQDLLRMLERCDALKQVLIMDACHSGSLVSAGGTAKGDVTEAEETEEVQPSPASELVSVLEAHVKGRKGFYALLSCSEEQQSWESPTLKHGVFTHYLIRGLEGHAVDKPGPIEVTDLYRFANKKTEWFAKHKLKPQKEQKPRTIIFEYEEIILGLKPEETKRDSQAIEQEYEQTVNEKIRQRSSLDTAIISSEARQELDNLKKTLRLRQKKAKEIEDEAIENHKHWVETYTQEFIDLLHEQYPIERNTSQPYQDWRKDCAGYLNTLLADDIEKQETEVFEGKLQGCREAFRAAMCQDEMIDLQARERWQQELGDNPVAKIAEEAEQEYWENLHQYEKDYTDAVHRPAFLVKQSCDELQHRAREFGLNRDRIAEVNQRIKDEYREKEREFEQAYTQWIYQQSPHESEEEWQQSQPQRGLHPENIARIKERIRADFEDKLSEYQQEYIQLIYQQHPLSDDAWEQLEKKRVSLDLHPDIVIEIDEQVEAGYQTRLNDYEQYYSNGIRKEYPLKNFHSIKQPLRKQLEDAGINPNSSSILVREQRVEKAFDEKLQEYQKRYTEAIYQEYPLSYKTKQKLEEVQRDLGLRSHNVRNIEDGAEAEYKKILDSWEQDLADRLRQEYPRSDLVIQELREQLAREGINPNSKSVRVRQQEAFEDFESKCQEYQEALTQAIYQQHPISSKARQDLQERQQKLGLNSHVVKSLEKEVTLDFLEKLCNYYKNLEKQLFASDLDPSSSDYKLSFSELQQSIRAELHLSPEHKKVSYLEGLIRKKFELNIKLDEVECELENILNHERYNNDD